MSFLLEGSSFVVLPVVCVPQVSFLSCLSMFFIFMVPLVVFPTLGLFLFQLMSTHTSYGLLCQDKTEAAELLLLQSFNIFSTTDRLNGKDNTRSVSKQEGQGLPKMRGLEPS